MAFLALQIAWNVYVVVIHRHGTCRNFSTETLASEWMSMSTESQTCWGGINLPQKHQSRHGSHICYVLNISDTFVRLNLQSWLPKELHGEINHMLVGFGQVRHSRLVQFVLIIDLVSRLSASLSAPGAMSVN